MGATAARRRRAAGALLAAVLAAGAVGGCAGQGLVDLTPRILPDKSCDGLAESVCLASENCFFNKAANKCGPFALPCSQYQTPGACQARPGCKGIMVPRCLPASRPAPLPARGCQGLKKRKCKKNITCNWNAARKYAFGRASGCTDKYSDLYKDVIVNNEDGDLDTYDDFGDRDTFNDKNVVVKDGDNNDVNVVADNGGDVGDVSNVNVKGDNNKVNVDNNDIDDVGDNTVVTVKGNNNVVNVEEVGGCVSLQKKKMCNSNAACRFKKVFHCVSRAQITPPTCDCSKEGSVCDACYSL